jgi:hypothetical protein
MMISHSSRFCQISPAINRRSRQSVTVHQVTKGLPKGGEVSSVPGNQVRKLGGSPVIKIDHLTELVFCTYIYIYIYIYFFYNHIYIYMLPPLYLPLAFVDNVDSTRWVHCFGLMMWRFTEDGSVHAWRMAWPGRWAFFSLVIIQAKADRRWTWSLGLTRKICRSAKWTMCCTDFLLADDLQTIRSIWTWTIGPRCPNGSSDPYPLASTRTGLSAISCANACCRRDKTGWLPICL